MMDDLLAQFMLEAPELVQEGADALMALETRPDDRSLVDDAFRSIHTLKGSVGLFDLEVLGGLLHVAEDVLGAVRNGVRRADRDTVDALLAVLSQTESWLPSIAADGRLPADAEDVARGLAQALTLGLAPVAASRATQAETPTWAVELGRGHAADPGLTAVRYTPVKDAYFNGDDPIALAKSLPGLVTLDLALADDPDAALYEPYACRLVLSLLTTDPVAEVAKRFQLVADQVEIAVLAADAAGAAPQTPAIGQGSGSAVRVDPMSVERLGVLAEDLVAARARLAAVTARGRAGGNIRQDLEAESGRLDRLAARFHAEITALRTTAVSPLLRRFPRVARDLARGLGKEVDLIVEDHGVQADRKIIEGLFEPLTHLIRNAVDHGIEPPEKRERLGKPRRGLLRLTAEVELDGLRVSLSDDGAGLDGQRIRRSLIEKGLMTAEAVDELDEAAIFDLAFLPGFSTANAVNAVSGRGVGMDAVRTAVHGLGGAVTIESRPGEGTRFSLKLPISLSLTRLLVVRTGDELYGVAMDRVQETVRLEADAVVSIRDGEVFNWRDRSTPLFEMEALLGAAPQRGRRGRRVLVCGTPFRPVGISVTAVEARLDAVVRPLEGLLAGMRGLSGTTVLGDGRLLMVVDPEALVG